MNFSHMCKNKVFLFVIFFILVCVFSYGMFYTKDKKTREKESTNEKIKRCVVPSVMVSFVIVVCLYYFKGKQPADVLLENEDYFG